MCWKKLPPPEPNSKRRLPANATWILKFSTPIPDPLPKGVAKDPKGLPAVVAETTTPMDSVADADVADVDAAPTADPAITPATILSLPPADRIKVVAVVPHVVATVSKWIVAAPRARIAVAVNVARMAHGLLSNPTNPAVPKC